LPRAFEPSSQNDDTRQQARKLLRIIAPQIPRRHSEAVTYGIAIVIELAKMGMGIGRLGVL
jgi:hypothetical protein